MIYKINPDITEIRFMRNKGLINQHIPPELHVKDNLSSIIWRLPAKDKRAIRKALPGLKLLYIRFIPT